MSRPRGGRGQLGAAAEAVHLPEALEVGAVVPGLLPPVGDELGERFRGQLRDLHRLEQALPLEAGVRVRHRELRPVAGEDHAPQARERVDRPGGPPSRYSDGHSASCYGPYYECNSDCN